MAAHTCSLSSREVEAGRSEGQAHLQLHSEFEASTGHMRLCLKPKRNEVLHSNSQAQQRQDWSLPLVTALPFPAKQGEGWGVLVSLVPAVHLSLTQTGGTFLSPHLAVWLWENLIQTVSPAPPPAHSSCLALPPFCQHSGPYGPRSTNK